MSPLMMRFFTLVGIALAAASMHVRARAEPVSEPHVQLVQPATANLKDAR